MALTFYMFFLHSTATYKVSQGHASSFYPSQQAEYIPRKDVVNSWKVKKSIQFDDASLNLLYT